MSMEIYTSILVPIILGLIASCASIAVAVINTHGVKKTNRKLDTNQLENELNNIRQQLLIMMLEDRQSIEEKSLPSNYKGICDLYDKYTSLGGNSYVKAKVERYFKKINELELDIKED